MSFCRILLPGVFALASTLPISAQQPELAAQQQAKQLIEIAAQKVEADVQLALRDAGRLAKTDVVAAKSRLEEAQAIIDADRSLNENRKLTLQRVIKDRIRVLELGPPGPADEAARLAAEQARQTAAKLEAEKQATEAKTVKEALTSIAKLKLDGKSSEANKLLAEMSAKYPDNLAVQLLTGKTGFEKAVVDGDKKTKDTEPRIVGVMRDVDNAANPNLNEVEFPKDWKTRTAARKDVTGPTEDERKLLAALNTLVDARYRNSRFQDVLDHLGAATGRTIIADVASLNEANVNYDTLVNFDSRNPISLRTALRGVLSQLNLTFVVRDGIIHVTSPSKSRDLMTTRVYYLGDLITGLGPYGGSPTLGMNLDQVQMVQNVTAIVGMITGSIDPQSWEGKSGQGHIGVNLPTLSLTVRQSQEVHAMLRSSLYGPKK